MDEGELPMDERRKLTAKYIYENEEWLKIALDVYEAKDAVRSHLIEQIWQGVEKRVRDKIDGIDGAVYENGFWFWHEEAENFGIYGELKRGQRGPLYSLSLFVGIYLYDHVTLDNKHKEEIRQEIRRCYHEAFGGELFSEDHYLVRHFVGYDSGVDRWDSDTFLRKAVMERDETESNVADLLVETYRGIEDDLKRIAKDVWG